MRYRLRACPLLFALGFLILTAPFLRALAYKVFEGPLALIDLSRLVGLEEIVSPDAEFCVHLFAEERCDDDCQKLRVVVSKNQDGCGKEKFILLSGDQITSPSVRWADDNEIMFSYANGKIERATGWASFEPYSIFLKIKQHK